MKVESCDALDWEKHPITISNADMSIGQLDLIYIAHGTLPDNEVVRKSQELTIKEFNINCLSVISLCTIAANYFEKIGRAHV